MTSVEYSARRDKILKALAAPQSVTSGDKGVTFRSVRDLQSALAALDAEWTRSQGTTTQPAIGRMYSGEGL